MERARQHHHNNLALQKSNVGFSPHHNHHNTRPARVFCLAPPQPNHAGRWAGGKLVGLRNHNHHNHHAKPARAIPAIFRRASGSAACEDAISRAGMAPPRPRGRLGIPTRPGPPIGPYSPATTTTTAATNNTIATPSFPRPVSLFFLVFLYVYFFFILRRKEYRQNGRGRGS